MCKTHTHTSSNEAHARVLSGTHVRYQAAPGIITEMHRPRAAEQSSEQ